MIEGSVFVASNCVIHSITAGEKIYAREKIIIEIIDRLLQYSVNEYNNCHYRWDELRRRLNKIE